MIKLLKFFFSTFFLLILYTLILIFPDNSIHITKAIGIFLSGITLLGFYISFFGRNRVRWIFFLPISLIHSYFILFSAADSLMQYLMGRPFTLFDALYLNDLYNLLGDSYGSISAIFVTLIIILLPALLIVNNYLFHVELGKFRIHSKYKISPLLITIGTGLFVLILSLATADKIWGPGIIEVKNILTLSRRKQEIAVNIEQESSRRTKTAIEPPIETYPFDKLNRNNVFVFIIESYGRTLFENPENWFIAEPRFVQFEKNLKAAGFTMASSSLESPAIGGNSWLADSTFNSGVWVKDQTIYDELIRSDLPVMGSYFKKAGYKTVIAQPGMRTSGDEEFFYNYDKTYNLSDFEYEGPSFAWATMSDQYVIDFIDRKEVQQGQKPLFAQYVLVSSHFPFRKIPAYIKNWNLIDRGTIYNEQNMVRTLPIPEGRKTAGPYGLTISLLYVMEVLTEYLINHLDESGLVIILGDHQPYSKVTGPYGGRQVAIHILAKETGLIEPFINRGYSEGLISPSTESATRMDEFLSQFLSDFSSDPIFQTSLQ